MNIFLIKHIWDENDIQDIFHYKFEFLQCSCQIYSPNSKFSSKISHNWLKKIINLMLKCCYLISHCWGNICSLLHRGKRKKEIQTEKWQGVREEHYDTQGSSPNDPLSPSKLQSLKVQLPKTLALTVSEYSSTWVLE